MRAIIYLKLVVLILNMLILKIDNKKLETIFSGFHIFVFSFSKKGNKKQ